MTLFSFLEKTGLDPQKICEEVGIPYAHFQNKENPITIEEEQSLWQVAIQRSNDPNFGLHFGMGFQGHAKGNILIALLLNSPNLEEALKKFVKYHDFLLEEGAEIQLEVKKMTVHLSFHYTPSPPPPLLERHYTDSFLSSIVNLVSHVSDFKVKPEKIYVTYPRPETISEHQTILKAPIKFGYSTNELIFPGNRYKPLSDRPVRRLSKRWKLTYNIESKKEKERKRGRTVS